MVNIRLSINYNFDDSVDTSNLLLIEKKLQGDVMLDARLQDLQEAMPGAIATKNKTGFMSAELSEISKQYIEFSKNCNSVLDIGCAYGISVLPVLDLEKVTVHAVDLFGGAFKNFTIKTYPQSK